MAKEYVTEIVYGLQSLTYFQSDLYSESLRSRVQNLFLIILVPLPGDREAVNRFFLSFFLTSLKNSLQLVEQTCGPREFQGAWVQSNPLKEVSSPCVAYSVFQEAVLLEFGLVGPHSFCQALCHLLSVIFGLLAA